MAESLSDISERVGATGLMILLEIGTLPLSVAFFPYLRNTLVVEHLHQI
jgi:hypothetical protein